MPPAPFHRLAAVVAATLLAAPVLAACGSEEDGSTTAKSESSTATTVGSVSTAPRAISATEPSSTATAGAGAESASVDDLWIRWTDAMIEPGMVTHIPITITTDSASPVDTEEVWFDPASGGLRRERRWGTGESAVDVYGPGGAIGNPETPIAIVLLSLLPLLAESESLAVPPGISIRADTRGGQPVTIADLRFEAAGDSPAQSISVVFDAEDRPLQEERRALDDCCGWSTKTITYGQTEFVDPAALPADFFDAATPNQS